LSGTNAAVAFFNPMDEDLYHEIIMVLVEKVQPDFSLDEYTELYINSLQESITDFVLLESNKTSLSGQTAHKIVYNNRLEGKIGQFSMDEGLISAEIWTIKNGKTFR
jgi:hypothetical protein